MAVTVGTVCTEADISRMTFYKYYRSRDDLLTRLCFTRLLSPVADCVQARVMAQGISLPQQFDYFHQLLLQWFRESGKLHRELIIYLVSSFQVSRHDRPELQAFVSSQLNGIYDQYQVQLKPGLSPEFCAATTTGAVGGLVFCWLNDPDYPVEQRLQQLMDYLTDSFIA